ncbi:MAG TPA: pentapeptide repeat-containing protein [Ktedonobacterales bacterium]
MSDEQKSELSRPTTDDGASWRAYWAAQGQAWRTEPEIDGERQAYLRDRQRIQPHLGRGVYPFGGVTLQRADVEWLLATHGQGSGPIDWNDTSQRTRTGIDLRGADLRSVDLRRLPLARMLGGIAGGTDQQYEAAAIRLENARLDEADLRGADLRHAHLERADLRKALLEEASVSGAFLQEADLRDAQAQRIDLRDAHLEGADCRATHLEECRMQEAHAERGRFAAAHLEGSTLDKAHFVGALLQSACLRGAYCRGTYLNGAYLPEAHLEGAFLLRAHLDSAHLEGAHLEGAELRGAYLQATNLYGAHLEGAPLAGDELIRLAAWRHRKDVQAALPAADLRGAFMDSATNLRQTTLGNARYGSVRLADVYWGGANLAVVPWVARKRRVFLRQTHSLLLGDEQEARRRRTPEGTVKDADQRLEEYEAAVRANRQLAVALRGQGLDEDAAQFAYRAQALQRQVLLRQYRFGEYLFSLFLDALAGYGYRPGRSIIVYLLVVLGWAAAYFAAAPSSGIPLSPLGSLVFSITSFHGRGFFPGGIPLDAPLTVLAAGEALAGLIIEISFIATFTQRFFGK